MIKSATPTDLMELEKQVRAFPTANRDVEGFFDERATNKGGRYEDWAKKDQQLKARAPDLYDNTGQIINRPGDSS